MQGPKNLKNNSCTYQRLLTAYPYCFGLHILGRLWQFTAISNEENYITQIPANQKATFYEEQVKFLLS